MEAHRLGHGSAQAVSKLRSVQWRHWGLCCCYPGMPMQLGTLPQVSFLGAQRHQQLRLPGALQAAAVRFKQGVGFSSAAGCPACLDAAAALTLEWEAVAGMQQHAGGQKALTCLPCLSRRVQIFAHPCPGLARTALWRSLAISWPSSRIT